MQVKTNLEASFDEAFQLLTDNLTDSLELMKGDPHVRDEIIELWKRYIQKFLKEATHQSEKYQNNDIIKAVTKMLIFGH